MLDVFVVAKLEWVLLFSGKLSVLSGSLWQRKSVFLEGKKLNSMQEHSFETCTQKYFPIKFTELLD